MLTRRRLMALSAGSTFALSLSGRVVIENRGVPAPISVMKWSPAGYMVVGSSPDELQTLLKSEVDKWSAVIKTVGIKIN